MKVKKLGKRQKSILQFFSDSLPKVTSEIIENPVVLNLKDSGFIDFADSHVFVTERGLITLRSPINNFEETIEKASLNVLPFAESATEKLKKR